MEYIFKLASRRRHMFLLPSIFLLLTGCGEAVWFLAGPDGAPVPVAADLLSCEVLASNIVAPQPSSTSSAYQVAVQTRGIFLVTSGTVIKQGQVLNFPDGHLTPWIPNDPNEPTTGEGQMKIHEGEFGWILIEEGPYKVNPSVYHVGRSILNIRLLPSRSLGICTKVSGESSGPSLYFLLASQPRYSQMRDGGGDCLSNGIAWLEGIRPEGADALGHYGTPRWFR